MKTARRLLRVAITVLGSGGAVVVAGAQQSAPHDVFVGSRVRVFAPDLRDDRYVGRVDSLDVTEMVLDTAGQRSRLGLDMGPVLVDQYRHVSIRLSAIREIEVSGGRSSQRSTVRGVIFGSLIGGLLWGLGNLPQRNPDFGDIASAFPTGAAIGAVVGGLVGFALGGEKWLPAVVPRP